MSIASAPAAEAGAEGEDTERLLLQTPARGVNQPAPRRPAVCRRVLRCAPPHRPTSHVEEFTPLTEDSLLFDGPRTTYGRFRVLHQIGAGSVGPVFRGEDPATRRPVVDQGHSRRAAARTRGDRRHGAAPRCATGSRRTRRSARCSTAASTTSSRSSCSAFVDGDSLDVALREYGPANIADALPRLRALADALDSAAAVGVVARQPAPARHHRRRPSTPCSPASASPRCSSASACGRRCAGPTARRRSPRATA